jgi:hypothetical protein
MSERPPVAERRFLSREEWLARRAAVGAALRASNIVRAAQMPEARLELAVWAKRIEEAKPVRV